MPGFLGEKTVLEVNGRELAYAVFWAILYAQVTGIPAYLEPIRILIEILCRNL